MAYENLTTYTKVDPNSDLTITSDTCSFDTLDNGANTWVYKDFTLDYFDEDLFHQIQVNISADTGGYGRAIIWSLTNAITDFKSCVDGLGIALRNYGGNKLITLYERNDSNEYDDSGNYSESTDYYLTIERDESIGDYGRLYCYIYDDINRTNLLDTLQLDLHEKVDFRYLFCLQRLGGSGSGSTYTGYIKNLNLLPTEQLYLSDTLTLSDKIVANIPKETKRLSDTLTLSDEILKGYTSEEDEGLALNEDYEFVIRSNLKDTTFLSDSIVTTLIFTIRKYINNIISFCKSEINDITNDIRTLAENKSDITNDIRFLKSWQVAGDAGFISLGKTYIRLYIDSVEQTDVDVNSITISKSINTSHTAEFVLGRPYDNTKPTQESVVEIKYHIWTLYKGYITQINPTDSPDSIKISCQDKYWKQNKTKKYFSVGHKPTDNQELYYNTISEGLSACGASFGIGNFIPQTENLFGTGESDCISHLVSNAGNYGWFYETDNSKKLWVSGQGDIINLEKQEIGKNLGLYQVIKHSFSDSIEKIVNKFRVQMGNQTVRRFNDSGGTKTYAGYKFFQYRSTCFSAWDNFGGENYARLATDDYEPAHIDNNGDIIPQVGTSGVFNHPIDENDLYKDVFIKYDLFGLDPNLENWSDRFAPRVTIRIPFVGNWKSSVPLTLSSIGTNPTELELTEGFTIDYEKGELTFNERIYFYQTDDTGKKIAIRKPIVTVAIYKKQYYSRTEDPGDDPSSDVSNPLMFFTTKCGDYSETILDDLSLSGLNIQNGGWYVSARDSNGNPSEYTYVPSWDDTDFAKDYANWQLSKNCDIKTKGNIELTLDTICFYDINLSKRIMIDGIINNPLNIVSISYNLSNWKVSLELENGRYFKRSVSIPSHGE